MSLFFIFVLMTWMLRY